MNKILLLLAALVSVAAAAPFEEDQPSELRVFESDETEKEGANQHFHSFCISSRDEVKVFLKQSVNELAARLFETTAAAVTQLVDDVKEDQSAAVSAGSDLIKEDARNMKSAVSDLASNLASSVKSKVGSTYANVKDEINIHYLADQFTSLCEQVSFKLNPNLRASFESYKNDLLAELKGTDAVREIQKISIQNVGCLTVRRFQAVDKFCGLYRTLSPTLIGLL